MELRRSQRIRNKSNRAEEEKCLETLSKSSSSDEFTNSRELLSQHKKKDSKSKVKKAKKIITVFPKTPKRKTSNRKRAPITPQTSGFLDPTNISSSSSPNSCMTPNLNANSSDSTTNIKSKKSKVDRGLTSMKNVKSCLQLIEEEVQRVSVVIRNKKSKQVTKKERKSNKSLEKERDYVPSFSEDSETQVEQDNNVVLSEDEDFTEPQVKKSKRKRSRKRSFRGKKLNPQEKINKETIKINENHPELSTVWDKVDLKAISSLSKAEQPKTLGLTLLPFQREGLNWLIEQESSTFHGGILADEMGMGKTIQIISLLLKNIKKPNLIIAPTVALLQWCSEIEAHSPSLTTLLYYGKERNTTRCLESVDVVLTSYNLIESMFRKERYGHKKNGNLVKAKSPLHAIKWERVILDEAHYVKDRSCSTSLAVLGLSSNYKWSVSGTPLQNRIGELFSTIRFLKVEPFSYYFCKDCQCKKLTWDFPGNSKCIDCGHMPMRHFCFWNREILKPIQSYGGLGEGKIAFEKLNKLLSLIMLRRTKIEKADDLGLPPKVVTSRLDHFNEEEEDFYESLYNTSKRKFNTYVAQGTVLNNYGNIFELITKMRLAANHPDLILKRQIPNTKDKEPTGVDKNNSKTYICVVCQEIAEDPIISKCKHVFCREDADQYISSSDGKPKCPQCYCALTIDLTQPNIEVVEDINETNCSRSSIVNRINLRQWRSSTKIEALIEELDNLRNRDNTLKSIIFSQFVNFLDLIQWRLHKAGFACCRLDGRMTANRRADVIKTFKENYKFTIFLISLKAGGIALNLTEASHVFICDPWWNPAVEDQAMDRIHRLGQHRPIKITRLIIENSIESRMLQLQDKKRVLFESTIGKDTQALTKLTAEDLQFLFL